MITRNKRFLVLFVFPGILFIGVAWIYLQSENAKEPNYGDGAPYSSESEMPADSREPSLAIDEKIEIVQTETVTCGSDKYIFDVSLEDNRTYYNDIYRNSRLPKNLLVHEIASRIPGATPKRVLAVPDGHCDRVFLTGYTPDSEGISHGMYEWRIGDHVVIELLNFKEFNDTFLPRPFDGIDVVSKDGAKVIVAQREDGTLNGCDSRIIRLYSLLEGTSQTLIQLDKKESLDVGISGEIGFCEPNYGWINENEIFYDVYSASIPAPYSFIERRTLKIE